VLLVFFDEFFDEFFQITSVWKFAGRCMAMLPL